MEAAAFWKAVVMDRANLLEELTRLLATHAVRYCVIGGQAVNAYVEPLVSLDLELTKIADAGLDHLRGLTNLQSLNLKLTKVTAEGAKSLREALPKTKIAY